MKAGIVKYITVIMAAALLGLLAFQFYFLSNNYKLNQTEFKNNVHTALLSLKQEIKDKEFSMILHTKLDSLDSGSRKIIIHGDTILHEDYSIEPNHHQTKIDIVVEGKGVSDLTVHQEENSQTKIKRMIAITSRNSDTENDGFEWVSDQEEIVVTDSLIGLPEEADLEHFVREIMLEMNPEKMDSSDVLALLHQSLQKNGIPIVPVVKWVGTNRKSTLPSDQALFPGIQATVFKTSVRNEGLMGSQELIYLYFPEERLHILKDTGLVLGLSGMLMLTVVFCFGWTLRAFNRQKKLSELKTDFINNMTHELKTPISTISIAAQGLQDATFAQDSGQVSRFAGIILDENERLKKQVDRVLEIARTDRGEIKLNQETLDFHEAVNGEVQRISERVESQGGKIKVELHASAHQGLADRVHLSGILFNLLENALKYSPAAPNILVKTQNQKDRIKNHDSGSRDWHESRGIEPHF